MWKYEKDGFKVVGSRETIARALNLHTCYEDCDVYDDSVWDRVVKDFNLSYIES